MQTTLTCRLCSLVVASVRCSNREGRSNFARQHDRTNGGVMKVTVVFQTVKHNREAYFMNPRLAESMLHHSMRLLRQCACLALLPGLECAALAQGEVVFANNVLTPPPDRLVYNPDGVTPLVGTNWCAQLYYGANEASLNPVTAPPQRFFVGTTTPPGIWSGARRTLDGFSMGQSVILQVRVWDCALFPNFNAAMAGGGIFGSSIPFSYTIPPQGSSINEYYMANFAGFTLIPEPAPIALIATGAAVVFARFRVRE
jgi:hypothetical protein